MVVLRHLRALIIASALALGTPAVAATSKIVTEEFFVPAADPGISLYVRNKHLEELKNARPDRILLFVHGATFPSEVSFDLELNGLSWMDYVAQHGYDVYMVDVRGNGKSTRPAEMDAPADQNEPIVRTDVAAKDVAAAVDFILKRRGVKKIDLMGWSWGTAIVGLYTTQHNDKVSKLVLYAPWWLQNPSANDGTNRKVGAYRALPLTNYKRQWLGGVPESRKADVIPAGWYEAFVAAAFASDPGGAARTPPVLRAPNGVLADMRDYWAAGKPLYDPGDIRVPTFLVHAEWDNILPSYMLYAYFEKLVNTPYKRLVQIGEGTHFIMLEKNRMQLFESVQQFLDENVQPGS